MNNTNTTTKDNRSFSAPGNNRGRDNRGPRDGRGRRDGSGRPEKKDDFDSKLLDLARVSRMTAGGRRFRYRAAVIVGDKKGKVGLGVAKGIDVAQAIDKATEAAKKELTTVPMINDTIPHRVEAKFGAAVIMLKPQTSGRGLVAGGTVRIICTLAGIKNVSSKVLGRTGNKINNAKATLNAIKKLKAPKAPKKAE
jgi:small subunit ribosomal protein S5